MLRSLYIGAFALLTLLLFAAGDIVEPAPIVVQPSQYWEGTDGQWSTFSLRVGSPTQVIRVLISTAWPNAVAIYSQACSGSSNSNCATARGGIYSPNTSTTFQSRGVFDLYTELNYTTDQDRGLYGLDTIGLDLDTGPILQNQVVAAIETVDYYFGYLGLDPQPTNWTANFTEQSPSFFKSLQIQGLIPSLTYSYTAGAQYRLKEVLGSLVFGGYDSSRIETNDLTFNFAPDVSRDLVVGIQSIESTTTSGTHELLVSGGVLAYIDSTTPYFVLPLEVCQEFEQVLGIEWNPNAGYDGLYTLSQSQHSALVALNPNITFTLGNSPAGGDSISINLPYAAFDLTASPPFVNSSTRYFPLLRAANDSQITLGRAFLQEAMLIADYERGNFSVYQCVWNANAQEQIQTIHSVNFTAPASPGNSSAASPAASQNKNTTTIGIGVGVGAGVPLLLAALLFFARWKRVWPFRTRPPVPPKGPGNPNNPELDSKGLPYGAGSHAPSAKDVTDLHEADAKGAFGQRPELAGSQRGDPHKVELPSGAPMEHYAPKKTNGSYTAVYQPHYSQSQSELTGSDAANEVEGSHVMMELPGSPVPRGYLHSSRSGSSFIGQGRSGPSSLAGSRRSSTTMGATSPRGNISPPQNPSSRGDSTAGSQRISSMGISNPPSAISPGSEDGSSSLQGYTGPTNHDRNFRSLN